MEGSPTVWQEDVSRCNILSLSIAGTAAVALASLPLAVSPVSAAKVSEGTSSGIGVIEASSDAQQFNLKTQGASTVYLTTNGRSSGASVPGGGGGRLRAFLVQLLDFLGVVRTDAAENVIFPTITPK